MPRYVIINERNVNIFPHITKELLLDIPANINISIAHAIIDRVNLSILLLHKPLKFFESFRQFGKLFDIKANLNHRHHL